MSKQAKLVDGTILQFPDDTPDDVMDRAVRQHILTLGNTPTPVSPKGRTALQPVVPEFSKPLTEQTPGSALKTVLDIPLDLGIGAETALGMDPMHPVTSVLHSLPPPKTKLMDIVANAAHGITQMPAAFMDAVRSGGEALREGNLPEAAQAVGKGAMLGEMGKGITEPIIRKGTGLVTTPNRLRLRAKRNVAPRPSQFATLKDDIASSVLGGIAGRIIGAPLVGQRTGMLTGSAIGEGGNILRQTGPYRRLKAAGQIRTANWLEGSGFKPDPVVSTPEALEAAWQNRGNFGEPEPALPYTPPPSRPPGVSLINQELLQQTPPVQRSLAEDIEAAIAPSGRKAKLSTLRTVPQLQKVAPEIQGQPKGPLFDSALMKAHERLLSDVIEAEGAVPRTVTVPKTAITSGLNDLAADYKSRGLEKIAGMIEKENEKWAALPDAIPWDDFVKRKRGFFQEHNVSSAPMMKAYRVLMDASSEYSGSDALKAANRGYSTVRRALDNANIDPNTGRRIMDVGKIKR